MSAMIRQLLAVGIGVVITVVAFALTGAPQPARPVLAQSQTEIVSTAAGAAHYIHYQGQLFNPNANTPLISFGFNASFRLYGALNSDGSGSNLLWSEDKYLTTNVDGLFSTDIGDTNQLNLDIFDGRELYLAVAVNSEELRPIQRITYVPYAIWARDADRFDGLSVDQFARIVAYGFVDDDGGKESGRNFSSSRQTIDGNVVYVIDIDGVDYQYRQYTTLVTPGCERPAFVGTGSSGGNLLVDTWDRSGNRIECRFQFVTLRRED